MQSPLREVRGRLGLTNQQLAVAAGTRPTEVSRAEAGAAIPRSVLAFLGACGIDATRVAQDQERYRREVGEAIRARAVDRLRGDLGDPGLKTG